jgi:hypothetical protein
MYKLYINLLVGAWAIQQGPENCGHLAAVSSIAKRVFINFSTLV